MTLHSHWNFKAALGSMALAGMIVALGSADVRAGPLANDVDCVGCVNSVDLASNAVTRSKLAFRVVTSSKIANGAVTAAKLAPDAVFEHIIVVRADPLDTTGNCDAVRDVLTAITDNDADHRYLIHLEPGTFDCGGTALQMKDFVGLQGSGRDFTLITGSVEGSTTGVVLGASDTELRQLSVENAGVAVGTATALYVGSGVTSFRATDVSAVARDSELTRAIKAFRSEVVLTDIVAETVNTTGNNAIAIHLAGIDDVVEMVNVTAKTDGTATSSEQAVGVVNQLTARNSVFISRATGSFAVNTGASATVNLVSTQLDATTLKLGSGTFLCVGAYDGAFAPLDDTCS